MKVATVVCQFKDGSSISQLAELYGYLPSEVEDVIRAYMVGVDDGVHFATKREDNP